MLTQILFKVFRKRNTPFYNEYTSNNVLDMLSNGTSQKSGLHMF